MRFTGITITSAESSTIKSNFDELTERLRNFHESTDTFVDYLRIDDIVSPTDPKKIEVAKRLYHKLLKKTSYDLELVSSQSCESSPYTEHTGQTTMSSSRVIVGESMSCLSRNPALTPRRQATCFVLFLSQSYLRVNSCNKLQETIFVSNLSYL